MAQDSQCWFPDGTTAAINDTPCNSSATISPCCSSTSICLDNGICMANSHLSRGSCTSKTWEPPCFQYCLNGTWNSHGGQALTACVNGASVPGLITCGSDTTCADESKIFQISGGTAVVLRAGEALGLGTTGPVLVPNTTWNTQGQAPMSCSASSNSEATVTGYTTRQMTALGVGLGLPLFLAFLAALATILVQRRQLKRLYVRIERAGEKERMRLAGHASNAQHMYTYEKPTGPERLSTHVGELAGTDASTMSSTNLGTDAAKSPVSP